MDYSFRLAARVILYASPHRQDNTSRGTLAGTNKGRNILFNDALNTFYLRIYAGITDKETVNQ